ncbi:response regulator transcription factor [Tissierella creatinini]|nr:response regulator transcription factor [Tissierella creatinini]TJX66668.1 response regulator transcription factor [Soehngenia saccharolytica]
MNRNILIVEDEKNILDVIKAYLIKEDFKVLEAMDGETALDIFSNEEIHLIILDLMLPKISGYELCKKIRDLSDVPIIMLTAKAEEEDKIAGLNLGADDYVTKPFSPRELMSRIKALLRRSYRDEKILTKRISTLDGRIIMEPDKMELMKDGERVELTPHEYKVLLAFMNNPNIVLKGIYQLFG